MAHHIQAIVAEFEIATTFCTRHREARCLPLRQDFGIIPVGHEFVVASTGVVPPQSTETFLYLTPSFLEFLRDESTFGRLAYVETEYFGGTGCEGATVLDNRSLLMEPRWEHDAVLQAVRHLGVRPENDAEMFRFVNEEAALGLGQFRFNDDIIAAMGTAKRQQKPSEP